MNRLVATHIASPETARAEIIGAYEAALGNGRMAAEFLHTPYMALLRILRKDKALRATITEMRWKLFEEGCPQRGWGKWQQEVAR